MDIEKCHPKSSCFLGSTFDNASFAENCMCCTDFRYTSLKNCNFTKCDSRTSMVIKGADFTGSIIGEKMFHMDGND